MTNEEVFIRAHDEVRLRGLSPKTVESYLGRLKLFLKYYNNRPIEEMCEIEIREYLLYLLDSGHSPGSVNVSNSALRFIFGAVMGLLTKCVFIYFERKKAIKKTPIGVIPCTLSSFLSSKRSPRGGSGPPLPLNPAARRVLSYAPTFGRQTCPRTRSAACAAHPDSPARFAGRDAVALWDGSRCPAAFAHRADHFRSNISPGKDSSGSLRGLPNTPSTHRWRCGTAPSREVLSHWDIDKHRSPHHKKRHPA